jgi:hypothetical protein
MKEQFFLNAGNLGGGNSGIGNKIFLFSKRKSPKIY